MDAEVLLGWLAELGMIARDDGPLDALLAGPGLAAPGHAHWRVFAALAAVPVQRPARGSPGGAFSPPS
jgi:hypothetical protein